jgi:hypothetical protein
MRSGEEIQAALRKFVKRWRDYSGTERGEAQTYLNELIACCGANRKDAGALFEDAHAANGIMDMYWPSVCIVEMKAPAKADHLADHREQALAYWHSSDDASEGTAAPPYVVLCAFRRFEVWEPGRFPSAPRADFTLEALPENYEKLLFLAGTDEEPLFGASYKELTTEAATVVAELYNTLLDRDAAAPETCRYFVLQMVWCLFAEDLGMLEGHPVQRIIEILIHHPDRSSYLELGGLFDVLNEPNDYGRFGVLQGTRYVNGSLFANPAKVHLVQPELLMLARAAEFDWRKVDPTIFGSLMENILGHDRRWELGAHYTHETDIMKIVRPTIIEPWRERITAATTLDQVQQVLDELCGFRVLDPACGCGNFLYVAYRELRSLEYELKERLISVAKQTGANPPDVTTLAYYPLSNLYGIDVEPTSVLIARVTLWMGQRQMIDRFGAAEPALPLVDLSGIQAADALAQPWPKTDCIIGNPPFLGSQHVRATRGEAYTNWLKDVFKIGVKDYCVYWFRKSHDHLAANQRAGLVGTNSITQNRARGASLEYIVANGGFITDAISTQDWPGEAGVDVSIVNWVKSPSAQPTTFVLDGRPVDGITPELRTPGRSTGVLQGLPANRGRCFEGPTPSVSEFIIGEDEAQELLARTDAPYRHVVRPYIIGEDITDSPEQKPRRWIIDFAQAKLEEAMHYPAAMKIVRERVKPKRESIQKAEYRQKWWQFTRPRPAMRTALRGLSRYIVSVAQGKRLLLVWADAWTCPSNLTFVFAFDDDYAMGILSSAVHNAWARSRSSTLEDRLRYTPSTVFASFPWPYPVTDEQRKRIVTASRAIVKRRQQICADNNIGLTALYNLVDDGAYTDLKALHTLLDEAVAVAYGWPKATAHNDDDVVQRLLSLYRDITAGARAYSPFGTKADATVPMMLPPG